MRRRFALLTVAFQAIVQHPLRSLLSTLGLVIGVAALVAILSLIDGMEQFAREQIESSTDIQSIAVAPRTADLIDGVTIRRDSFPTPTPLDARALDAELGETATVALTQRRGVEVRRDTVQSGAALMAAEATIWANAPVELKAGRFFSAADEADERRVVVISTSLAERLAESAPAAVGRTLLVDGREAEVIGVADSEAAGPASVAGPYAAFAEPPEERAPTLLIHVNQAEMVPIVAEQVRGWLDGRFEGGQDAFAVNLYEDYAVQLRQGILLFKLIMGFITGISVIVGGVGVMNVLLIAVSERTREIGVRKATGAKRGDIVAQFLGEAIAVSGTGSLIGLAVGLAAAFAFAPLVRAFSDAPFHAAFSWSTLVVVGLIAVLVGVLFGTYPALRAARLSPVDAMRHE